MPKPIDLSLDNAGNLVLSDRGTTNAGNMINRKVSWKIKGSGIESFKIVGKKPGDPFTTRPNSSYDKKQDLEVRFLGPLGDWYYSIYWKDSDTNTEHHIDPKIAVKPAALAFTALALATSTLIYLVSMQFLKSDKNKKK